MNHYPHHIGDFAKDTLGFSQGAIGAYRLLMDAYYANEEPIAAEDVYVIGRATTAAERKNVEKALTKFELIDGRYHHKRVDEELAAYRERSATASASAKKRWCKQDAKPMPPHMQTHMPTHSEGSNETDAGAMLASSHKPINPIPKQAALRTPTGVDGDAPLAALAAVCVRSRVNADGGKGLLHLRQFVADGVTEAVLADAVLVARDRKPEPEVIPIGYLAPIVADLRAGRIRARPMTQDEVIAATIASINAKEAGNAPH